MKKTTAYITAIFPDGKFESLSFPFDNPEIENKVRNLKAGSITSFDIPVDNPKATKAVYGDAVISESITLYPANLAVLSIKIVESEDEPA